MGGEPMRVKDKTAIRVRAQARQARRLLKDLGGLEQHVLGDGEAEGAGRRRRVSLRGVTATKAMVGRWYAAVQAAAAAGTGLDGVPEHAAGFVAHLPNGALDTATWVAGRESGHCCPRRGPGGHRPGGPRAHRPRG